MRDRLAIIGFGAFGRFMAGHLKAHAEVVAFDQADIREAARAAGVVSVSLAEAAQSGTIVLVVPVQHLPGLLSELSPLLQQREKQAPLVIDVASVKVRPITLMLAQLPNGAEILGTHPLFGPQSGRDGIAGLPIAFCPVRASEATTERVRRFLSQKLALKVVQTNAEAHDRQMACVQGLTHLISRSIGAMELPGGELTTRAYEQLRALRANLAEDSWDLFVTIERENPFALDACRRFRSEIDALIARLEGEAEARTSGGRVDDRPAH